MLYKIKVKMNRRFPVDNRFWCSLKGFAFPGRRGLARRVSPVSFSWVCLLSSWLHYYGAWEWLSPDRVCVFHLSSFAVPCIALPSRGSSAIPEPT